MGKSKKAIGIITMHKVPNFGSALQAYALQQVVFDFGYDCELIDYIYPNEYHKQFHSNKGKWYSFVKTFIPNRFLSPSDRDNKKIRQFWKTHFKLSRTYNTKEELQQNPPRYDIYLTGSDQVWNPRFIKGDTSFLLSFAPDSAKKIAYSSSFACAKIDKEYLPEYKRLLSKYSQISVREKSGQGIVKTLTGKDTPITLDPTLLLKPEDWDAICSTENKTYKNEEYIFAYVLDYAVKCTPYIYEVVKYFKNITNYRVIYLDQKGKLPKELSGTVERPYVVSPATFISLFKNAKLVITSSFHGTAFAANFGVPLYSIISKETGKDSRQLSLLTELGISNRAIPVNTPFDKIENDWDDEKLQLNLTKLRDMSRKYLLDALQN